MKSLTCNILLLMFLVVRVRGWNSCAQVRQQNETAKSGVYLLTQPYGNQIEVYCDFREDHGYAFIARDTLSSALSLSSLTSSQPTDALLRFKYNHQQYETVIGQLPRFQHLPVSYQINSFDNYTDPRRSEQNLFFGIIPARLNGKGTRAGYTANGHLYEFTNCDGNPNSYFVFYVAGSHAGDVAGNTRPWMTNKRESTAILPNRYFYHFDEHQGGCGVLFKSSGAAIGLKFELEKKVWRSCAQIREENEISDSGIYHLTQPHGTTVEVYCDFREDHGYVFIARDSLSSVLSLSSLTSSKPTDALLRFKYNHQQYESVIGQLPRFQYLPVSYQINSFNNYTDPRRSEQNLFFGIIPARLNGKGIRAGYTANGHLYEFTNCDGNPNSYFVFYVAGTQAGDVAGNTRPWMTNKRESTVILPNRYFYHFDEHQGGCGVLFQSSGAAIGLKFELEKKVWSSCAQVREENETATSGIYRLTQPHGTTIEIYCDFREEHGYVFIARDSLSSVLSLSSLTSSQPTEALLRFKYNHHQYETVIGQLPRFQHLPVSYQINSFDNYTDPRRSEQNLFFGIIPARLNGKGTRAGYTANGHLYEFTNCDGNPNSYFVFYVAGSHAGDVAGNTRPWMTNKRESTVILPNRYFYHFDEHQGGCGVLFKSSGAAIGLRFEIQKNDGILLRTKLTALEHQLDEVLTFTFGQNQRLIEKVDQLMKEKEETDSILENINSKMTQLEAENQQLRIDMTSTAAIMSICLNPEERNNNTGLNVANACLPSNSTLGPANSSANTGPEIELLKQMMKINARPTCHDWKQLGFVQSGYYSIDPDGVGFGEPSFGTYCDMTTGYTFVRHNSEGRSSLINCMGEGCYMKGINYEATDAQIQALKEASYSCQQFIQVDCMASPFTSNGRVFSWWNGDDGKDHSYWSGEGNHQDHVCTCGLSGSCVDPRFPCNCDSNVTHVWLHDKGYISDMSALPVREMRLGGMPANIRYSLGPLRCFGRKSDAFPQSCNEAMMDGGARRGYYIVGDVKALKLVFCDNNRPYVTTQVMDLSEIRRNTQTDTSEQTPV